ncbi:MAG TPA: hypothetical protein VGA56_24440 [Opitutaceae bacterium]
MIAYLPPPSASAYSLIEELREPMGLPGIHRVAMDDLEIEQALLAKLGARGWGRIHHFRNHYNQPWGERRGEPLSPRALDLLARFVTAATFPTGSQPSVFLTDHGTLELCWEDATGAARQVEFKADGIDYFIEATGEEASVGSDRLGDIVGKLACT